MNKKLFLNGTELKSNATLKEGQHIICIDPDTYKNRNFTSQEASNLQNGYFMLDEFAQCVFSVSPSKFWERFSKVISISKLKEIRSAVGYTMDKFHNDELRSHKLFVPSDQGINSISVEYKSNDLTKISGTAEERLKCIVLYYNAMYNNSQKKIIITSTKRTPEDQAKEVYDSVKGNSGKAQGSMYQGYSGMFTEQELKKGTPEQTIKDMLVAGIKGTPQKLNNEMVSFTGFSHIDAPDNTADIGVLISNTWAKSGDFPSTLEKFKSGGKYLNSQTLIYPAEGEKECHHLVILT